MDTSWAVGPLGTGLLIGATLTTGLTAGLLYAFAHTVMPGLRTLPDTDALRGFQRMDAAIPNPWMGLSWAGGPVLTAAALTLHLLSGGPATGWLAAALVLLVATLTITGVVHLPLNSQVQAAAPEFADASSLRAHFEQRWVTWNLVRTVTTLAALSCLTLALVTQT